jgi:hypothetical protein
MLIYRRTDMPMESRHIARKLCSNAGNELFGTAQISTAFGEEKASPKLLLIKVSAGNSTGNGRLSRTR